MIAEKYYAAAEAFRRNGDVASSFSQYGNGIKEIVLTDSIPLCEQKRLPNMTILSVAELFAGAISRIHDGRSVTELFR